MNFDNHIILTCERLLSALPNPKLEDHPMSVDGCFLRNVLAAALHSWRLPLHPERDDAPCRDDKGPI
jgi:hypothetical protein